MKYKTKTAEAQARDLEGIEIWQRIDKQEYFEQLQLTTKLIDIDTYEKVNVADRDCSMYRASTMSDIKSFDKQSFLAVHKHLFQDIYYFAGQIRDVPMEVDSVTRFASPNNLNIALDKYFDNLKKQDYFKRLPKDRFIKCMAHSLTEINILHPFREGNGRTKRIYFTKLAKQAGYELDWAKCSKEEWKYSDEAAFDNYRDGVNDTTMLEYCLNKAIEPMRSQRNAEPALDKEAFRKTRFASRQELREELKVSPKLNDFIKADGLTLNKWDVSDVRTMNFVKKYAKFICSNDVYCRNGKGELIPYFGNESKIAITPIAKGSGHNKREKIEEMGD